MVVMNRAPTTRDYKRFSLADYWLYAKEDATQSELYILVSKELGEGLWLLLGGGSVGDVVALQTDDAAIVLPNAGIIGLKGGSNINTTGATPNATVNLNDFIVWPATSAAGTAGIIYIDGETVFHTYDALNSPSHNLFAGEAAGNLTLLTAERNVGLGTLSLASLITGDDNFSGGYQSGQFIDSGSKNTLAGSKSGQALTTGDSQTLIGYFAGGSLTTDDQSTLVGSSSGASLTAGRNVGLGYATLFSATNSSTFNTAIGSQSLTALTSGDFNSAIGDSTLGSLLTGSENIAIGYSAGGGYAGAESNNIVIGSQGLFGESDTIRIGDTQTSAFVQGIYGTTGLTTPRNVVVQADGQLGTDTGSGSETDPLPFFAYLAANSPNNIANNVEYLLGTDAILTISYDDSGGFFPGDGLGTPASFKAPTDGKYMIVFAGNFDVTNAGTPPFPFAAKMRIISTATTFQNTINPTFLGAGTGVHNGDQYSAIVSMTAGDTITFGFFLTNGGFPFEAVMAGFTARGLNSMLTWVSGYKISN